MFLFWKRTKLKKENGCILLVFSIICLLNSTLYSCLHSTEHSDPVCIPESLCSFGSPAVHFLGSLLLVYSRHWLFLFPMSTQSCMLFFFQKFVELSLHWYLQFHGCEFILFLYFYTLEGTQASVVFSWSI